MAAAAGGAGIVNQVGLVLRFLPAMNWLRHLVTNLDGGRVMSVVFRDDQYIPIQGMYGSTWRYSGSIGLIELWSTSDSPYISSSARRLRSMAM